MTYVTRKLLTCLCMVVITSVTISHLSANESASETFEIQLNETAQALIQGFSAEPRDLAVINDHLARLATLQTTATTGEHWGIVTNSAAIQAEAHTILGQPERGINPLEKALEAVPHNNQAFELTFRLAQLSALMGDVERITGLQQRLQDIQDVPPELFMALDEFAQEAALSVGRMAPTFSVTAADGKPLNLEDYRGKSGVDRFLCQLVHAMPHVHATNR